MENIIRIIFIFLMVFAPGNQNGNEEQETLTNDNSQLNEKIQETVDVNSVPSQEDVPTSDLNIPLEQEHSPDTHHNLNVGETNPVETDSSRVPPMEEAEQTNQEDEESSQDLPKPNLIKIEQTIMGEDEVKNDKENKTSTETSNKSEDSIPSFSEWTKLQLAQRKDSIINSIKNKTSLLEGKNFASPDCGAKVINWNPEAQNANGVISSSHDEYMLNRCTTNVWFILELCEPLTIERVSIGNLELFSSNPHEFELGVSDRYPTRDWIIIGPYYATDSRSMHSFALPTNNSTFGKYLRVIVKSHHGNEHYCPLSLIKVYGRSEYEVLESETTHEEDMDNTLPGILEEEMNGDKPVQNSVIGTVLDMVKKATVAFVSKKPPVPLSSNQGSSVQIPTCHSLSQCIPDSEDRNSIIELLSCDTKSVEWASRVIGPIGFSSSWDQCHSLLANYSIGGPTSVEGLFIALRGQQFINALCHFKEPIKSCRKNVTQEVNQQHIQNGGKNESIIPAVEVPFVKEDKEENGVPLPVIPQQQQSPEITNGNGFGNEEALNSPNQKESVFVRLSNRIKALERNQSLSSGYLEELSQRFKKQNEDIHSAHEGFRKGLNESLYKSTLVEQNLRYEIRKLNRNIDALRELLTKVETQRSGMFLLSIFQLMLTCSFFFRSGNKSTNNSYNNTSSTSQDSTSTNQIQRKRSSSQPPKHKRKKKRKGTPAVPCHQQSVSSTNTQQPKISSGDVFNPQIEPTPRPIVFEFQPPSHPIPIIESAKIHNMDSSVNASTSDLSETSEIGGSRGSLKKKSKLKSFLFGKGK